ncbi:MAG: hypothetical protein OXN96_10835 [Bryobacterales bacterium]|nr:hypothetical protein [Bryobacterales bacterium]
MLHNGFVIGRRRFLAASAALPFAARSIARAETSARGLRLTYKVASPPKLPPPLDPGPDPRIEVEFQGSGRAARCSLGLQVLLDGEPHLLPLAIWTEDPRAYWRMREALHLPALRGAVRWADDAWTLAVSGRDEFSARATPPAAEADASAEDRPWLSYRHQLSPSWAEGPLGDRPVELWRSPTASAAGATQATSAETSGKLGGWLARLGASGPVSAHVVPDRSEREQEFARHVAASDFEPFALRNYSGGSLGLPEIDTQFSGAAALEAYRGQSRVRLPGLLIVSVDCVANPHVVERLVPAPCIADPNALVRVMAIRGLNDPSLDEAWLLARCGIDGQRAWYAISHLKNSLAGSEFGREAWGYPTQDGEAHALLGANRFTSSVMRGNLSLYRADGSYGGFSTGTSLNEMLVVTLRPKIGAGSEPRRGELLLQPWYYQGLRKPLNRQSLYAAFTAPPDKDASNPWNRMGPVDAYWADIYDDADLQRLPAALAGEVPDIAPYYRDRCDGHLPWEPRPAGAQERTSD